MTDLQASFLCLCKPGSRSWVLFVQFLPCLKQFTRGNPWRWETFVSYSSFPLLYSCQSEFPRWLGKIWCLKKTLEFGIDKQALYVRKQSQGHLLMIASDVTLRQWKCAEEGNEHLCGFALPQHQSTTLEHSLSVTTTIFPLWTTLYICKKNLRTRACAPLIWGNTDCMLIQGRCEETWEAKMLLDSLSHWDCGAADVFSWQRRELEHLSVLVLLELLFPFFFVWSLVSSHRLCCFYMWCHGPLSARKSSFDGLLMEFGVSLKPCREAVLFYGLHISFIKPLIEMTRLYSFSFT